METRQLSRVVWEEGMHLSQHHFQAQSRFFEDASAFAVTSLVFRAYGFVGLELDREALTNGTVRIGHARGFMPDGLPFHFPHDPPPPPLDIRERFSPTQPAHTAYLAIPAYRPGAANAAPDGDTSPNRYRFVGHREERVDEVAGEDRQPVSLARKNFRLVLDPDLEEDGGSGLVVLPVARVLRDGAGSFVFDPAFVPPVLHLGAVPELPAVVDRVVEMLKARVEAIEQERRARGGGMPGPAEIGEMWLGHAVHQSLPSLRHLRESRGVHPEAAYVELARLAGGLGTFAIDASPDEVPLYDHDDLGACFGELERLLRRRLEVVLPTGSYRLSVTSPEPFLHEAEAPDREALHSAELFLGVRSSVPEGEVSTAAPRLMKVCSAQHIRRLVKEAFPGLALQHVPAPPSRLRPQPGTAYFRLEKSGPCWASITDTGALGIYLPAALPDAELELVVVPPE